MQSIAVLLLEMTYQKKDKGSTQSHITVAIKKMVQWLHAMSVNDPVAAKACAVFQRILQGMAPILQAQANEILGRAVVQPSQPDDQAVLHQQSPPTLSSHANNPAPPPTFFDNTGESSQASDPQYSQQQVNSNMPDYTYEPNMFSPGPVYPARAPFGNPFFTDFDQDAPLADLQNVWALQDGTAGFDTSWMDMDSEQPPGQSGSGGGGGDTGA
jgi:hypothetical protein